MSGLFARALLLALTAGATTHTDSGFLDLDGVAGRPHRTFGMALMLLTEGVLGADIETAWTPSALTGHDLIEASSVLTATGSLVIALPQRWSRVVRPYATIGAGMIHVTSTDIAGIFPVDSTRAAASAGGGAWIAMTSRLGVRADARWVRSGGSSSPTRFRTWQTSVGATIRF
jgi:opacity protein-like surface antigen